MADKGRFEKYLGVTDLKDDTVLVYEFDTRDYAAKFGDARVSYINKNGGEILFEGLAQIPASNEKGAFSYLNSSFLRVGRNGTDESFWFV